MTESERFSYDVFLSYPSGETDAVRLIANKLNQAGLRVCFEYEITKPGETVQRTVGIGIERSRTLVLFVSADSLHSDWSRAEIDTLRFRDPLNKARRFVAVRLDDTPPPVSLSEVLFVDMRNPADTTAFELLLNACRPPAELSMEAARSLKRLNSSPGQTYTLEIGTTSINFSSSGSESFVALGRNLSRMQLGVTRAQALNPALIHVALIGHAAETMVWDEESKRVALAAGRQVSLINLLNPNDVKLIVDSRKASVTSLVLTPNMWAAGLSDGVIRTGTPDGLPGKNLRGHTGAVGAITSFNTTLVSGSDDQTIRLWAMPSARCLRVFEGHTAPIRHLVVTRDGKRLISGSDDCTIRLWDLTNGMCIRVFIGHTAAVGRLAFSLDDRFFASAAGDLTLRLWDTFTGECLATLDGHRTDVRALRWCQGDELLSADIAEVRRWKLLDTVKAAEAKNFSSSIVDEGTGDQVLYTNAKVLLVGESGAGKTGLSKRLASGAWELSASTVGAWATQWKLPLSATDQTFEREIWLWDFGGQADQRLIHQLYMDETSLVVLIFDGQKADVFESLGQWDNDVGRASQSDCAKLLVAGRVDASPVRLSRSNIDAFCAEHGYREFLETSALTGQGCENLKQSIVESIDWDKIPWRSSPRLFKLLKEEIVRLKDEGKTLMRFNDLREMLVMRLHGRAERFSDEQLKSVLSLLAGPGIISELAFGGWVLFQPQLINVYAQAVLNTMLQDQSELGCLLETDVLAGKLSYHALDRVPANDEKFILLAMHHALLERGICSVEATENGNLLVFPSYFKRQRPELQGHPAVLVSYYFEGFVPEIYSTLVVRLHHTDAFTRDKLWQDAADFKTRGGLQIGLKLSRRKDGTGQIEVYCDPSIILGEKIIFLRYVHEHLKLRGVNVKRVRHYSCQACTHALADTAAAASRTERGLGDIGCPNCDERVVLLDEIEEMYLSPQISRQVQGLEESVDVELDNESKERVLVGDVTSAVAQAGQIGREKSVSDHGIDMEVEFKDDLREATGQMIYLQLKSGDSYLRTTADGREIFIIKKQRHAAYWMKQNCPVFLVIRSSSGEIRWMEIREYLKEEYKKRRAEAKSNRQDVDSDETLPKQIEFKGEAFNTASILRWRAQMVPRSTRFAKR